MAHQMRICKRQGSFESSTEQQVQALSTTSPPPPPPLPKNIFKKDLRDAAAGAAVTCDDCAYVRDTG